MSACASSSHALHEPASTCRIVRARPSVARMSCCSRATTTSSSAAFGGGSLMMPMRMICRSTSNIGQEWLRFRVDDVAERYRGVETRPYRLQILPAVRQVEGLVDQRKVRNDVPDDGVLEHGPVRP